MSAPPPPQPHRAYLSGLRLSGRRVVVVGAGAVAERRLPRLLACGAVVTVVAPEATPGIVAMAERAEVVWLPRPYAAGDLAGAWYVLVATGDPVGNAAASAEAEENRTFCVRADQAEAATAWTPATGEVEGLTVGVLAGGHPRRAGHVRDLLLDVLRKLAQRVA
ncbi:MAG: Siroheme synthase or Precorrin-2 oxidase or Sirohydrochlorin ferrochelatase or Uroporphyrinogen-III [Friedmanniella sp.]|nr:Siroheme synthase or Precorrin-2 oxidase or Sirohydrochlorin ferrochelatase or Uroporphyrinogen-III [Friedmanniella sp.]